MRPKAVIAILTLITFILGFVCGRQASTNPTIVRYQMDAIVITHDQRMCPSGHVCQWKAWDLNDNKELK